jgi:hypothetical protein
VGVHNETLSYGRHVDHPDRRVAMASCLKEVGGDNYRRFDQHGHDDEEWNVAEHVGWP